MTEFDEELRSHTIDRPVLASGESIFWQGKPKKKPFILAQCLTMLPIAIVWICFDFAAISSILSGGGFRLFLLGFFALHLMPVWIWLGMTLSAPRRWRNTSYFLTNRRIIIRGGFLAVNEKSLFFKDIRSVQRKVGIFDKLCGTGTIVFNSEMDTGKNTQAPSFQYLENSSQIYERVQRTVLDIQTDMEFPNAYRPGDNPGYGTDYKR
jgi:membrane protein YdbS with pleckstrin-like domain